MDTFIREQIPLHTYTTLRVGGLAKYFVIVNSIEEVEMASQFVKQTNLPFLVLGGGSNLLINDDGYKGVVIYNQLKGKEYVEHEDDSVTLICQAGEILDEVIQDTVERGYWGLENLSSIPGTVGATPVQNVGAYGVEVSDFIECVEAYHIPTFTKNFFKKNECNFSYRDSFFKTEIGKKYFITAIHFRLQKKSNPKITYNDLNKIFSNTIPLQSEIRNEIISIRSEKFPDWKVVGTAGSFFKNPIVSKKEAEALRVMYPELPMYDVDDENVKISLGYALDKICNLKGYRLGDAGLYSKQALVLVNYGNKNAEEIKNFSGLVTKKIYEATKIIITPEVNFID